MITPPGPSVSAVVVTLRVERFIADCLESLLKQTHPVRQIVVVDNGSTDETCAIVRRRFPQVRLIELGRNTGFCHANNVGLRETQTDFVLFANPDTILEPTYLQEAMAAFEPDPRTGAVTGKLLRFDRTTIDSAGQVLTRSRKIQDRGYGQKDVGQFNGRATVDSVCGAMALYRREMIDEISLDGQLFDEDFFAFWEDMDVGWRAKRAGWEARYVPTAVAYHFRGGSQERHTAWTNLVRMSGRSVESKYHIVKNRWLMLIKNERAKDYLLRLPFILARDIAMLVYLLVSAPAAFMRLLLEPGIFVRAWQKRRRLLMNLKTSMADVSQSRPKAICFVISKLGVGGAEKNLLLLTGRLPRDRYAPVVLSLDGEGEYAARLRAAGVPVYALGFPRPAFLWRLIRFFSRCPFDLFHGFMFHGNLAARVFARLLGKPSVSAVRVAEGEKRWHLWLDRWTARMVDRYTANSAALAGFVTVRLGVPAGRIRVIPNALAEDDLEGLPDRARARRALGLPEAGLFVSMVGRLHFQKDPETFVRAARVIAAEVEGVQFGIAGIGPLKERLERMIASAGLGGRFHLLGLVDARAVYAASDVFVLPSRWEGFPNAAIEAMAAGRPVVLADFEGASEVVDYGVTGMVFPRGDDRALSEAVVGLLRNESARTLMGQKAQDSALAKFTVERLVKDNMAIYDELVARCRT